MRFATLGYVVQRLRRNASVTQYHDATIVPNRIGTVPVSRRRMPPRGGRVAWASCPGFPTSTGSIPVNDGQWHHVVSVFPEGGEIIDDLDHYVDGMLEDKNGNTSMFVDTDVDLGLDLTIDEPSTWALLALGFVGLAATGRGRRST